MTGQTDLFGPMRPRLGVRNIRAYHIILLAIIEAKTGGRLIGARRWSRVRWEALGLQKSSVPPLEAAGFVQWVEDDLTWVGWDATKWGRREAFNRDQAKRGRLGSARRWGRGNGGDRLGDRLGDRHRADKPAQSLDLRIGDTVSGHHGPRARAPEISGSEISSLAPDPHEVGPTNQRPRSPSGGVTIHPPLSSHRSVPPSAATPVRDRASTEPEPEPEDREARTGRSTPRASRREPGEVHAREAAPSPARPGRVRFGDMSPGARRVWASYPRRKIRKRHMWPFWEAWQRLGLEEYGAEVLELLEDCSRMAAWRDHPSHVPWSWNFLEQQAAALLPRWARAKANRPGAVVLATERPPPTPEAKAKAADAITAAIELREAPPVGTWYTTSGRLPKRVEEPDEEEPRAPLAWAFALWPAGR